MLHAIILMQCVAVSREKLLTIIVISAHVILGTCHPVPHCLKVITTPLLQGIGEWLFAYVIVLGFVPAA